MKPSSEQTNHSGPWIKLYAHRIANIENHATA
jgi:hypothetical protein